MPAILTLLNKCIRRSLQEVLIYWPECLKKILQNVFLQKTPLITHTSPQKWTLKKIANKFSSKTCQMFPHPVIFQRQKTLIWHLLVKDNLESNKRSHSSNQPSDKEIVNFTSPEKIDNLLNLLIYFFLHFVFEKSRFLDIASYILILFINNAVSTCE